MSMKPGRELDALIAEKVFGIYVHDLGQMFRFVDDYKKGDIATAESCPVPAYSTDIAAAWEVVEKLGAASFHLQKHPSAEGWEASFGIGFSGDERFAYFRAIAPTAPHAICLVALKISQDK